MVGNTSSRVAAAPLAAFRLVSKHNLVCRGSLPQTGEHLHLHFPSDLRVSGMGGKAEGTKTVSRIEGAKKFNLATNCKPLSTLSMW